jgi:hypothetical protein
MGHPATEPPAKQEGKRPSDADLLGYLTTDGCSTPLRRAFDTAGCWGAMGRWPGGPLVRVVGSVEINRPAGEVWACVADYGNDPSLASRRHPDAPIGGGGCKPARMTVTSRWTAALEGSPRAAATACRQ